MKKPERILVLGATGYIGGRLVPRLLKQGYKVRCLARNPDKVKGKNWDNAEIAKGNIMDRDSLEAAMKDVDLVYYLVHLMMDSGNDLIEKEKQAAYNTVQAAEKNGVQRIIYLGALGKDNKVRSKHLKSRHATSEVLKSGTIPVTEFAAGVVIGSGSASFEVIHHLVNKLPIMIAPRWVSLKTQPIGTTDIIRYLTEAAENPLSVGETFDVGCPEVITYKEMMLSVARELNLKRYLIPVPILTPKLSSYWLSLVTPVPVSIGRTLIESLTSNTICQDKKALEVFSFQPKSFYEVVREALLPLQSRAYIETHWTDASGSSDVFLSETTNLKKDTRVIEINCSPEDIFYHIKRLGGKNGWYFANKLWYIRGFIDKRLGGVGLKRGRKDAEELNQGDALDFFRVEEIIENEKLLLTAEMKTGGSAWLEFLLIESEKGQTTLKQTAYYYPHGIIGFAYWYLVYPIHAYVFNGMIKAIKNRAEKGAEMDKIEV